MNIKYRINQIRYYLKRYGIFKTIKKCFTRLLKINNNMIYQNQEKYQNQYKLWIEKNEPNMQELELLRKEKFKSNPLISIIVPMYNTDVSYFKELVECMLNQIYTNWELCLADRKSREK